VGMSLKITDEQIAEFSPEVRSVVYALLQHVTKLETIVENQAKRIAELEEKLGLTPRNSSKPPSSEHPHAKPPPKKPKSKRKRGGQPGHPKHERELIPSEDCDEVVPLAPTECRRCGELLTGEDPNPLRHQVWELPEIKPR